MSYNPLYGSPAPPANYGYPGASPQQGYPGQQPQQGYPGQAPQQGYPGQPRQQGYPGQQPQQGYPGQLPQQGHPGQPPQQGHPGQPPQQGHPGQLPQQGHPGQPPQQGYPGQPPQQGYPGSGQPSQHNSAYGAPGVDPTILSWFRAVDQDNSGQINGKELSMALQNGNRSNFSEEACKLMIAMFDADHSGTINVQEFGKLFQYINQWTEMYRRFDQDSSGTIDERELGSALQQMGYRLSPQFVSYLVNKFNPKERKVSLDNFIVANVQLHRLTEAFKKKDTQFKGTAAFNYEEFITIALTV